MDVALRILEESPLTTLTRLENMELYMMLAKINSNVSERIKHINETIEMMIKIRRNSSSTRLLELSAYENISANILGESW
jgi:hypothetical protein